MSDYLNQAEKVLSRINELAAISEDEGAITRRFGTDKFLEGSKLVYNWFVQTGLQTRIDNIGNVRGRLLSALPEAKTFVIASHIDTVVNAGKFDGPLGVLMGLDLLANIDKSRLPFTIELIAFCDEEGVRFHTTYLGSKVVCGTFDKALLMRKDADSISLYEAIEAFGGNPNNLEKDALAPNNCLGYFEIHIEQGPVLYEKNIPAGIVTAIAGQNRIEVSFTGFAGHAGTVPMHMRQDALCAAAEFILKTEKFALENKGSIVATVGKLNIPNSASNVIPGQVICSLDLRSADEEVLKASHQAIRRIAEIIGEKRNIEVNWNIIQQTKPVACDDNLNKLLAKAVEQSGFETVKLVSGAGHDAVPFSEIAPVSMLFVRCFKGISHNPLENADLHDIAAALKVSDIFLDNLINEHQK